MTNSPLRLAFATYAKQPDYTSDDRHLVRHLETRGHTVDSMPWDQPGSAKKLASYDATILRSTWNYTDYYSGFCTWLEQLEANGVRLFNGFDTVRWNSDKIYLRELNEAGHRCLETTWLERGTSAVLSNLLDELEINKAVIKPRISATARGLFTTSTETAHEDQKKLDSLLATHDAMLQPFAPEIVHQGEWSLVFFGSTFSHALIKRPEPGDLRVQTEFGGTAETATPSSALIKDARSLVDHMVSQSGHPLYSRVDGIERDGRLILMELELIEPELFFRTASEEAFVLFETTLFDLLGA